MEEIAAKLVIVYVAIIIYGVKLEIKRCFELDSDTTRLQIYKKFGWNCLLRNW